MLSLLALTVRTIHEDQGHHGAPPKYTWVLMVHNGGQFNPGFEGREWKIASVPSKA